jgi:SAM-dependent methyltransferase
MNQFIIPSASLEKEAAVRDRYARAARSRETALCCNTKYPEEYLSAIPEEILQVDYGCGDPTPFAREGDVVLDLGSGSGKLCYMLAQVVGPSGRVVGVDCNEEMLALARRHRQTVAARLGYANVEFRCGMIQDLQLDVERLLKDSEGDALRTPDDWLRFRQLQERLREEAPLVADESMDCVVSNCVLNLVRPEDRRGLFSEIFRVLKPGGRAAISDIVADEDVPEHLQGNSELWSGCISGAHREDRFLEAFEEAGFHGIEMVRRGPEPWRVVEGIEFYSTTVVAYKGKQGPCLERNQALIYKGPFRQVEDDDGHVFRRGRRVAVCDKTFRLLDREPYTGMFDPLKPREPVPLEEAVPFDCSRARLRDPRETKGKAYDRAAALPPTDCCSGEGCC